MKITDRVAAGFGITPADREHTVGDMLAGGKGTAAGYWLQLATAMFIATLGLVLGSTAVVIGAMLVSPLMTPIIRLGMGLAIGSPVLVVRSAIRFAASCAGVVFGAALVVLALPFHEVTSEISARTSPTALDLGIASCCAIAGLYAAVRSGSDATNTAAGTAIGIALVPPLCVVGFGMGTGASRIAGGAALLFTANFCAIALFSVLGFLLFGFGSVDVPSLERAHAEEFEPTGISGRVVRRLSLFFASRAARVVRIAMPAALVGVVFVPLRSALGEVAWEISVRTAVQDELRGISSETVQSQIRIDDHDVAVRVVVIGDAETARRIRTSLRDRVERVAPKTKITIEVLTVADSHALARAEAAARETPVAPLPAARDGVSAARRDIEHGLQAWPAETCGPLITWHVAFPPEEAPIVVTLVHLGPPLGPAASDVLARSLTSSVGDPVRIADVAMSPAPIEREVDRGDEWIGEVTRELTRMDALGAPGEKPFACIVLPRAASASAAERASSMLGRYARARLSSRDDDKWSFRWSAAPCIEDPDAAAADAGDEPRDAADATDGRADEPTSRRVTSDE